MIIVGALLLLVPPGQWALAAYSQYRLEQKFISMGGGNPATDTGDDVVTRVDEDDAEDGSKVVRNVLGRALASFSEDPALELPEDTEEWGGINRPDPDVLRDFPGALIRIPTIKVRAIVLYGTTLRTLAQGPGFYEVASLPDQGGNVAIAGHRTTYGAWFRHVDRLQAGDPIELEYRGVTYRYEVERVWVINRNDWSVVAQTEDSVLTLTTCHPPGSAAQRMAVRARLIETIP